MCWGDEPPFFRNYPHTRAFLASRKAQRVVNEAFFPFDISVDVPQGSPLPPTLFIIFIDHLLEAFTPVVQIQEKMSHPPKSPNGNATVTERGLQWVPIANSLKSDVAPIVDPFSSRCWPLFAMADPTTIVVAATGFPNLLNLGLNLLNYNGFETVDPLQPVGHPLQ